MTTLTKSKSSILSKFKISEAEVKEHQIRPRNLIGISSDEGFKARLVPSSKIKIFPRKLEKVFNSTKFVEQFHESMKNKVVGYAFQIRKMGVPNQTIIWNWSRTSPDGGLGWTLDYRMHIASVSKMMTGIAMYKLLCKKSISLDAPIHNYLPSYWTKGPNVDEITFRNLLNHTSGLNTGNSKSDYTTMMAQVKNGVSKTAEIRLGKYKYANMNFGICRILIAIINGNISKNEDFSLYTSFGIDKDQLWDSITIGAYKNYVQAKVFTPAGIQNAGFKSLPFIGALAYNFPSNAAGWDSGNLSSMSGGAGWRLSINEVLQVMDHLRRKETILSSAQSTYLLDNKLGIDQEIETPAGVWYSKNGRWTSNKGTEQCVAAFLPDGYEIVVFVNSPIDTTKESLSNEVYDTYLASLV